MNNITQPYSESRSLAVGARVITERARRNSRVVWVGSVAMGGGYPIRVQSMTDTDTADIDKTVSQIIDLTKAGSELVRITVNSEEAALAVPSIVERVRLSSNVPIVGDFHYNGHRLLSQYPECARALDKYRINPGNVGFGDKRDKQFALMVEAALKWDKPIRIGVNWGSLDQAVLAGCMDENARSSNPKTAQEVMLDAMVISALESARYAEVLGLPSDRIVLSCKVSGVQDLIIVSRKLAQDCDYAIHLGLTEAGMGSKGIVASTAALAILLQEGIGDTIRCSLTPEPGGDRIQEVIVCQEILQTMGLRAFSPMVSACPGCGRTTSAYFRELADTVLRYIRSRMPVWSDGYCGVENMTVAVMGCVVNGPGESKQANIGISLPGNGEVPVAPVFVDGKKVATLRGDNISESFIAMVEEYVKKTYPAKERSV